jgi:branched-chain amino acid transport system substrate-binding protein
MFTAGSACSGTYWALKLWQAAVTEAGSLDQDEVIAALDHASIPEGPGGPAEMVPGQHHVRMNMYIARSEAGTFNVVENLGCIDPRSALHIVVEGDPPRAALVAAVGSSDQLVPWWCCRRSPRWPPMAAFRRSS